MSAIERHLHTHDEEGVDEDARDNDNHDDEYFDRRSLWPRSLAEMRQNCFNYEQPDMDLADVGPAPDDEDDPDEDGHEDDDLKDNDPVEE